MKGAADLPRFVPVRLRNVCRRMTAGKRQTLFAQHEPVTSIFFIFSGEVEAVRYTAGGEAQVMLRASPGEFFGEAALYQETYSCSANAIVECDLAVFPKAAIREALLRDAEFAMAFLRVQISNMRRQCSRFERVRLRKAEDRVIHYLACETPPEGTATIPGSLADWANELGLRPESLYRALGKLRGDGRITGGGASWRLGQAA